MSLASTDHAPDQPLAEGRFDAWSWATLALALLIVAGSVALMMHRLGLPEDGYGIQPEPFGAPLRDDVLPVDMYRAILAIDGQPATEILERAMTFRPRPPASWRLGGQPTYRYARGEESYEARIFLRRANTPRYDGVFALSVMAYVPVAALVFARRPRLAAARVLLLLTALMLGQELVKSAAGGWSVLRVSDLFSPVAFWPTSLLNTGLFIWLLLIHLALVFPRPKAFYARRLPLVLGALYGIPAVWMLGAAVWSVAAGRPVQFFAVAAWPQLLAIAALPVVTIWSLAHSYRTARDEAERAQVRWGGLGLALLSLLFGVLLAGLALTTIGVPAGPVLSAAWSLGPLALAAPPLCIALAILRYRLFEIDLILNRALVYGALTLALAAAYVLVAGGLGLLLGVGQGWPQTILAVGAVAALANPLRERLQRAVNRALYGERDAPYAALALLGDRLGGTIAPDAVLPTIVAAIADALRAPYAAITAPGPSAGEERVLAAHPAEPQGMARGARLARFPIVYQGEALGELAVAPRQGEAGFSAADVRLLSDLARQAGAAVHGARLTADLRRSREQLVLAREEERRRLQRDIHDGLGPALGGLSLKVDAARNLLADDPAAADGLLAELGGQIQGAVVDIRRLVYALRPPVLGQLGLAGAIEDLADKLRPGVEVELRLPTELPALPAAVELAAYRIIQEALTNVARHSGASRCTVALAVTGARLAVTVGDDGRGLPDAVARGVGLGSMRERAEELGGRCEVRLCPGGGTEVRAELPL